MLLKICPPSPNYNLPCTPHPSLKLHKQTSDLQAHGPDRGTLAPAAVLEDSLVLGTPEKTPIKAF